MLTWHWQNFPAQCSLWNKKTPVILSPGLMYSVDSNDKERIEESRKELFRVLGSAEMAGVPVVVVANKQDFPSKHLNISILSNRNLYNYRSCNLYFYFHAQEIDDLWAYLFHLIWHPVRNFTFITFERKKIDTFLSVVIVEMFFTKHLTVVWFRGDILNDIYAKNTASLLKHIRR